MDDVAQIDRLEWSGDGRAGSLLVLPGASGGIFQSPLYWPTVALVDAGWEVFVARWSDEPDVEHVTATARDGIRRLASTNLLVMGKSLGSLAAPEVSRARARAVWLTPLMVREAVAESIESGSVSTLVVGGTSDPSWRRPSARPGLQVLETPGANHGLIIPGDWRRSLSEQSATVERILAFAHDAASHP